MDFPWMDSPWMGTHGWFPHSCDLPWMEPTMNGIPTDRFPWLGPLWMDPRGWDPSGWQCQAKPCLLSWDLFSQSCSCLAGIAGSVATLLHDAVMNPAEGNSWDAGINPSWLFSLCAWPGESRDKSLLPLSLGKNRKKFRAVPSSESSKTTKPRGLIPLSLGKRGRAARGN